MTRSTTGAAWANTSSCPAASPRKVLQRKARAAVGKLSSALPSLSPTTRGGASSMTTACALLECDLPVDEHDILRQQASGSAGGRHRKSTSTGTSGGTTPDVASRLPPSSTVVSAA
eukprot:CAMPEP_0177548282 /NCGR_PEP_ID=MMETSP0369-20130122/64370_1 /TAXON_ID=447022 ORGANISM="Scrippsiella hangoei-like, Strain SHHI-4" /NCGR_SAMPLE_ID=MMETSP0369 /ASSEMBLY_ACC=CAM_ASM_000364 /LENGTH=115 /DNA_ID=CAMNT_0019033235 /DNA_START=90 /DNA_END=433 /DNA_ORIENTATION=-